MITPAKAATVTTGSYDFGFCLDQGIDCSLNSGAASVSGSFDFNLNPPGGVFTTFK
jgi:hypothetical protein